LFLSLAATLLPMVLHAGKTASIFVSNSLDTFLARSASAPLLPICPVSSSKNSGVLALLDLNHEATLSIQPSSLSLLISNFLFLFVSLPIVFPTPPITPVKSAPSVPNLTLFNISLAASGSSPRLFLLDRQVNLQSYQFFLRHQQRLLHPHHLLKHQR